LFSRTLFEIYLVGFQGQTNSHLCFIHCFSYMSLAHMNSQLSINKLIPPTWLKRIQNWNSYQFLLHRLAKRASQHQQKKHFHRTYWAGVRTKPVRSLPPLLPDLLSPLCLSSLPSGAPGHPTFPPKCPTRSFRPHPLQAPSCCIRHLIFSYSGLLPTLTNCTYLAALLDPLSPLAP